MGQGSLELDLGSLAGDQSLREPQGKCLDSGSGSLELDPGCLDTDQGSLELSSGSLELDLGILEPNFGCFAVLPSSLVASLRERMTKQSLVE